MRKFWGLIVLLLRKVSKPLTRSVAWSSSRGHTAEGEFLGFLYTRPSSSASWVLDPVPVVPGGSTEESSQSSSSSGASVTAAKAKIKHD